MIDQLIQGKSLFNKTAKDVTLEQIEETARQVDAASTVVCLPANRVSYHGSGKEHRLLLNGQEATITQFALKKYLSLLKIPYGFFNDNLPEKTRQTVVEDLSPAKILSFQTLNNNGDTLIRGVHATNKTLVSDGEYIHQLKQFVGGLDEPLQVIHPSYTIDGFSFRAVFPDRKMVITDKQSFSPGFHVQHSVTNRFVTTAAPFLVNWFCYNGLIDLEAQKDILKQKSVSVPPEALQYVFQSVWDWMVNGDEITMFKAMKAIYDSQMSISRKDAERLVKEFVRGLTVNYAESLDNILFSGLPADPKYKLNAYTFYNDVTQHAQDLEPWAKNVIESNVTSYTNNLYLKGKVPEPVLAVKAEKVKK